MSKIVWPFQAGLGVKGLIKLIHSMPPHQLFRSIFAKSLEKQYGVLVSPHRPRMTLSLL